MNDTINSMGDGFTIIKWKETMYFMYISLHYITYFEKVQQLLFGIEYSQLVDTPPQAPETKANSFHCG